MVRYAIAVGSLGEYRVATMRRVKELLGAELEIYAGQVPAEPSIRVATAADLEMVELKNLYLPGRILLQALPLSAAFADVLVIDLNPRVALNWLLLVLRKLLGRPTILWGHAFPRAGRTAKSEAVRRAMRSLADGLIAYTRTQAEELRHLHPGMQVHAAPNALYPRDRMRFDPDGRHGDILQVGRLVAGKRPERLLEAFELVADRLPADTALVFAGDGPLLASLSARVARSRHAARIRLLGHVADPERIERLHAEALCSVSPGYVGLSITQSLGFGVPMIISRDEPHAPEIEAAREGENALFFEHGDPRLLADRLLEAFRDRALWRSRGALIAAECARNYSVEAMADGIVAALTARPA